MACPIVVTGFFLPFYFGPFHGPSDKRKTDIACDFQ